MSAIGIDLGGTHLRWSLIDREGEILYHRRAQRPAEAAEIVVAIQDAIAECRREDAAVEGIGLAVPGVVAQDGSVTANNLDWHRFPLRASLAVRDLPVLVANDMAAGALGELTFGRARGMVDVIYLTVSTGIGAGIIIDGEVYRGANGGAGEVGHTVVDLNGLLCGCGRRGCWEMMASGTAHRRRIHEAYEAGTWPNLDREPSPAEVTERARSGDKAARALVQRTGRYLGIGVANLINLYDPEAVIFTGGFARSNWDLLRDYLESEVRDQALTQSAQLLLTSLGDDAGILGAASLVFHHLKREAGE